jgi:putative ATPase
VTLVGATTENPSFALNAALLSRAQVLILHRLDEAALAARCWPGPKRWKAPSPSPPKRAPR